MEDTRNHINAQEARSDIPSCSMDWQAAFEDATVMRLSFLIFELGIALAQLSASVISVSTTVVAVSSTASTSSSAPGSSPLGAPLVFSVSSSIA